MADLVGALEGELADLGAPPPGPPPAPATPKAAPPTAKPAAAPRGGEELGEVFAEFKEELEEGAAAEEDIETHYNMGVAFKEMNLLDEAIGEFQKAYQAAERASNYANFIQCCTLLAHCFMEKNIPELAVRWLERALKAPGIDREGELALRYEIGAAYDLAGNTAAALNSFMEVYALNIDYRDVADRIRALKGK